jgi:hypothetical protein
MWDSPTVEQYDEGTLKIADELTSMDSKKLVVPPSSKQ